MTVRFLNLAATEDFIPHAKAREMPPPRCWYSWEILSLPSFSCLLLPAVTMESLLGWVCCCCAKNQSGSQKHHRCCVLTSAPHFPCAPHSAQWQSSFVPSSWLWQCMICLSTNLCLLLLTWRNWSHMAEDVLLMPWRGWLGRVRKQKVGIYLKGFQ